MAGTGVSIQKHLEYLPMTFPALAVFMVHPTTFGFDEQTAKTNTFQQPLAGSAARLAARAETEFMAMVKQLRDHDIAVVAFEDAPLPPKPNAVFPNNWLTMWPDGRVFLYPMATESRRRERSQAALRQLAGQFELADVVDLSAAERQGRYLEGTGVLVFDHAHRITYASVSPRCDEALARQHIADLGYQPVIFHAYANGAAIYHTNVLMGVQTTTAVVCAEAITDAAERQRVLDMFERTGHEVVVITPAQMAQFCGNVMELQNRSGERFLLLSRAAYDGFTLEQRTQLSRDKTLLPVAIPTIETIGGGSARCMVAEIFLPPKKAAE